jgi:hypothetical protein
MPEGFSAAVRTAWHNNHRDMILIDAVTYTDPSGIVWQVPAGSFLNGATIPRSLWTLIGSPYTGAYRRASVIHDYFVGEGTNPEVPAAERKNAEKMFYHACRYDGCNKRDAAVLYLGVRTGSWFATRGEGDTLFTNSYVDEANMQKDVEVKSTFNRLYFKLEQSLETVDIEGLEMAADEILASQPIPGTPPVHAD